MGGGAGTVKAVECGGVAVGQVLCHDGSNSLLVLVPWVKGTRNAVETVEDLLGNVSVRRHDGRAVGMSNDVNEQ